jgi:hypothetical protein
MQEVDKLADDASCNDTTAMVLEEVFQSQSKSGERESPQICQVSVLTDFNKSYKQDAEPDSVEELFPEES